MLVSVAEGVAPVLVPMSETPSMTTAAAGHSLFGGGQGCGEQRPPATNTPPVKVGV